MAVAGCGAARSGALVAEEAAFVPVRVVPEPPSREPEGAAGSAPGTPPDTGATPDERIEIVLADGTAVRVSEAVGPAALRRVLSALRG